MQGFIYAAVTAALLAVSSVQVEGMQTFLKQLPNGDKFSKQLGHTADGYTAFGNAFLNADTTWSADFCKQTFPGSKLTNGQAFGDPCCVWKAGAAAPQSVSAFTTDPGAGTTCATDAKPSTEPAPAPAPAAAKTTAPTPAAAKTTAPATADAKTTAPKADSSKAPSGDKATKAPKTDKATKAPKTDKATKAPKKDKATKAPKTEKKDKKKCTKKRML